MKNILFVTLGCIGMLFFSCKDDDNPGGGNGGGGTADVQISISDVTKFEGNEPSTYEFKVRLSAASEQTVTVDFKTADAAATAGEDYVAQNGTLSFGATETTQSIFIEILADTLKEGDEDFLVQLSNPTNAIIDKSEALGTMRNDDTFLPGSDDGYITPTSYAGMSLAWADEFNGTEIDLTNWTHELGASGWGNQELQNYTARPVNSYISNGQLVIEARKENFGGADYTSARMITMGKREFTYGRIDIRAKLPVGQGMWPALWMLGANFTSVGWPHCGEIDIMENVGFEPHTVHGTAHYGPPNSNQSLNPSGNSYNIPAGQTFADEFHVYTIIWENNSIKWFVDDNQFHSITQSQIGGDYNFNNNFFFIFNIAVGGQWPGSPDASTVFPQRMFVDYVRVFQ